MQPVPLARCQVLLALDKGPPEPITETALAFLFRVIGASRDTTLQAFIAVLLSQSSTYAVPKVQLMLESVEDASARGLSAWLSAPPVPLAH